MRKLYRLAREGRTPAERLTTHERERLVTELHAQGWADVEIAEHCFMTEYTTARIRTRLGLRAHRRKVPA